MSLLGIDVGTTACKVATFSTAGQMLGFASLEYEIQRSRPGRAELDAAAVYRGICLAIRKTIAGCASDPVTALAVSSMGEAMVPVTDSREILGPSILNFDERGLEFLPRLCKVLPDDELYRVNGNTLGNHYGLTKLLWVKEHEPDLYERADHFLLWGSFFPFMLGAEPAVDYSLANRTLLFDLEKADWSSDLLGRTGLSRDKLPAPVPAGTRIGTVSSRAAGELGLGRDVAIVAGAHDQCANAVGCGVIEPGTAVYGMGTFVCITPVFEGRRDSRLMIERGLNTEHHAVPGKYVSFIYNQGGSAVRWFRDTFASRDHHAAHAAGRDVYDELFAEMPAEPGELIALADFAGATGAFLGMTLATTRSEVLKAIVEGNTFELKARVDGLEPTGIQIREFRAAGGGSKADAWVQIVADIMARPVERPAVAEAGALGAAILAGIGSGVWLDAAEGIRAMVRPGKRFEPDPVRSSKYAEGLRRYLHLRRLLSA